MPEADLAQISAAGPAAGLPRPRLDGMPVPWITRVDPDGPVWARIDPTRLLRCQDEWLCQVCGQQLPRRAWVVLEAGRVVVSDAAMHAACVVMAFRWCPHLINPTHELEAVQVEFTAVHADDERLDTIVEYGDEIRSWTIPTP
ncbi:hypothetical protein DMH01_15420 [Amycolatopsis sp. WAC 04182]|uniref:hypothetical protein n=1 Tax=Amycolatopsis sp. WAC 04182 TaxID=2203198 RepID=UPI000F7A54FA|nr:hypothetical protein [Amycolatopsis sp. WAC 04182]RSN60674.1 hypothetical protein DMH01_15420 [Amycolatopsis sp. WAC 04182]